MLKNCIIAYKIDVLILVQLYTNYIVYRVTSTDSLINTHIQYTTGDVFYVSHDCVPADHLQQTTNPWPVIFFAEVSDTKHNINFYLKWFFNLNKTILEK